MPNTARLALFIVWMLFNASTPVVSASDLSTWYGFEPTNTAEPGEIGLQDWFEAPAGERGRITREGDRLLYDNAPIKLWGINLCFSACAPEKALADQRAAFYPKYGINTVRLHKFMDGAGWAGIQATNSGVEYDPEGLDRMDYQIARFKEAGIYTKLSAHFGLIKLGPDDVEMVPYLEEFGEFSGNPLRVTPPHSAIHYSPELQNAHIQQMVNLLQHTNPYTGLPYAEDPAIAFIEIINEQSILFYSSMRPLQASATLRERVAQRFSDWLRDKYEAHEELQDAWGESAFDSFENEGFPVIGEHMDERNILPLGNPWYWDLAQLEGSQAFRKQRLLDSLAFLYELQNEFYDRYVAAIRDAGYDGEIVASNWQAGENLSHLLNLHSDWRVGTIDRHNYFGGGSANPGESFNNASMLHMAGAGTLSVGMQQTLDSPFMLSEWIHVFPNEWGVEGPALIGAYGMGLQGWDVSYIFQNRDSGGFSERIGRDRWDAVAPQVFGLFPAVARQVLRGDIQQADVSAPLYVHAPSLVEGKVGFRDQTIQQHDVKSFNTDKVPARALAVARAGIVFTDAFQETPEFDIQPFERDGYLYSSTGQLRWREGDDDSLSGYFCIDTPGTQAVVGFAEGRSIQLGDVTIAPESHYGAIYVSAQTPDGSIASSNSLLITAIARARNTGMEFNSTGDGLLERGAPPIVMEPVRATITLHREGTPTVYALDHDGLRTEIRIPIDNGAFRIDGERDKTPYYLVVYRTSGVSY